MKEFPEVMTVRQVAEYLQVSTRTVYCLLANGQLRGARVGQRDKPGKAWRVRKSEADRFLAGGEWQHAQAAGPDGLTEDEKGRELLKKKWDVEPLHVGTPILGWHCTICGTRTFVLEFATGGLNWPEYCCGCGAKATLETMEFEGRYECSQPWAKSDAAPGRGRR